MYTYLTTREYHNLVRNNIFVKVFERHLFNLLNVQRPLGCFILIIMISVTIIIIIFNALSIQKKCQ